MTASFIPARRRFLHHAARFAAAAASATLAPMAAYAELPALDGTADPATLQTPVCADPLAAVPAPPQTLGEASPVLVSQERALALFHTHTRERIDLVYATGERYVPEAMDGLNRFLRDHYSGKIGLMDPQVFDQLYRVRQLLGSTGGFEVISGYRCPATNSHLRQTRGGGVAKKSLHMEGRAIDVRLPGVPLAELHEAALSLRAGGVGFYPEDQFVHLDTGSVRNW